MALPVTIPNEFANATASIPLSQLDTNFNTLANAVNGISNGSETLANVTATVANITTANVGALNTSGQVVFNDAGADVDFRVEGDTDANLLFVDASADKFGIGTSSPGEKLTVQGDLGVLDSSSNLFSVTTSALGTTTFFTNNGAGTDGTYGQYIWLSRRGSNPTLERMRIDSSGNVGIGTSSPGSFNAAGRPLVVGSGSGNTGATIFSGNAAIGSLHFADGTSGTDSFEGYVNYNHSTNSMQFGTGFTERMRIDSSGNLLINTTTSTPASITSHRLVVERTGGIFAAAFGYSPDAIARTQVTFFNSNGAVGTISTNGSATAYNTSSDYRLKHDIQPMTGALAKVQQLKPVTYKWKVDGSDGEGFIAHELQKVAPYAVSGEKDGEEMQGVDYGKITPLLTAALQEAIAEIQSLKARVAELEAK
jgi:hypothetical protein